MLVSKAHVRNKYHAVEVLEKSVWWKTCRIGLSQYTLVKPAVFYFMRFEQLALSGIVSRNLSFKGRYFESRFTNKRFIQDEVCLLA